MNISDEILRAALLGTDKYVPAPVPDLAEFAGKIQASQSDKEDGFLRYAATAMLFETCGQEAQSVEVNIPNCPPETKAFFPSNAVQWLKTALTTDDALLRAFLLFHCHRRNEILPGEVVPILLNESAKKASEAKSIVAATGELGQWLIHLNPAWAALSQVKPVEINWETGSHADRLAFIRELRMKEPSAVVPLLEEAFPQENANNRQEFLELLEIGLSIADAPFLELMMNDKSKKMKDLSMSLLRRIPDSSVNRLYTEFVFKAMRVKEERVLIFGKKKVLEIDRQVQPSEALFKLGLSKMSSVKGVEDHQHWLEQTLPFVHPEALLRHLQVNLETLLDLVQKETGAAWIYENGLQGAAINFRHASLAKGLFERGISRNFALFRQIPEFDRKLLYSKVLEVNLAAALDELLDENYTALQRDIAVQVLQALAANPYHIQQPTYRRLALHLPASLQNKLQEMASVSPETPGPIRYFANQATEMLRLLEIKESLKL